MADKPNGFALAPPGFIPSRYDNHIERRLSNLKGQYADQAAYEASCCTVSRSSIPGRSATSIS